MGIQAPARSSPSYANAQQLFEGVFHGRVREGLGHFCRPALQVSLQEQACEHRLAGHRSEPVDVSTGEVAATQGRGQAVKLHPVLDHDGYLPCFDVITDGTGHDVKVAQQPRFAVGTIVVDDRGYNDSCPAAGAPREGSSLPA